MKQILGLLLLGLSTLFADFDTSLWQTTLVQTDGKHATVTVGQKQIPVGSSGIILHTFDKEHKTIIARAIVTAQKENSVEVTFSRFQRLKQSALPEYKIIPAKGDILILNYLYNRVLPITPDEVHFKAFKEKYGSEYEIIHPDLFAATLYFNHQPQPTKEDFQKSCRQNDTSLLYFEAEDQGHFVDCNSFRILHSVPLQEKIDSRTSEQPFYSRLPAIKNRLGGIMGSESIGNYNLYYKKLLGLK